MNKIDLPVSSRRQFLQTSGAIAAVGALSIPAMVHAQGSDSIRVGLIGCGGRGSGAAKQAMNADKGVFLTAMADAFPDRLADSLKSMQTGDTKDKCQVSADTSFVGLDAYKRLLDTNVDAVILTAPPGFRPQHFKAAVDAGKHVFAEKPVAVDSAGIRSVIETVQKAKEKNLAVVSGFCWRYNYAERETFKRLHEGAIGDLQTIYCHYNANGLWNRARQPNWTDAEWQLRNWLYFTWLSGDHIVEQAVHTIDKMMWAMKDVPPLTCWGTGGRQARVDPAYGHIWDHFAVVYEFANPNGGVTRAHFYCRQQDGTVPAVKDFYTGTQGACDITSGSSHKIKGLDGKVRWSYDGERNNMYQTEHDEMYASIRAGKPINDGVRMTTSTLAAIMGRMAAYTGQPVTWKQAFGSSEDLWPKKFNFGPMPTPPVPVPGKTKIDMPKA